MDLATILANTLDNSLEIREKASNALAQASKERGFLSGLIAVIANNHHHVSLRQSAAIAFKRFVEKNWKIKQQDQDPNNDNNNNHLLFNTDKVLINDSEREEIKLHIVSLMLSVPREVQVQISSSLSIISACEFPDRWPKLLPELISKFDGDNKTVLGVLETAKSIFHRYRYEVKSEPLWKEILYVLGEICEPLTKLMEKILPRLNTVDSSIQENVQIIRLIAEIFLSLNSQDLPEFFEDNMEAWFTHWNLLLSFKCEALNSKDDEPSVLDSLQAEICEIAALYTQKYEDEFSKYVPPFVTRVWDLLTSLNDKSCYDILVTTAIKFLTVVIKKAQFKHLFENEAALTTLAQKVVIPQIKLRESDVELFSMNGIEYVRRDMEGSDVDTRRRTTVDFVRGLCEHFEPQVSAILKEYIGTLLSEYASNPKNWLSKDAAMYIVLALSSKSKTNAEGVTTVNPYVPIMEFFKTQVIPELMQSDIENLPVLKADCLKFILQFRSQLDGSTYVGLLPLLIRHLASSEYVVHTYAAATIERLLAVREKNGPLRLSKEQLAPFVKDLLTGLFAALENDESKENDYLMKAIMRVCSVCQENMAPYAGVIITRITDKLAYVAKNPKHPFFNHYLFETVAALVHFITKAQPSTVADFQQALLTPFQYMLSMDSCLEFRPYVFQILALILERQNEIPVPFTNILGALVHIDLYKNEGNVPALTRLLSAALERFNSCPGLEAHFIQILQIFELLNNSTKLDEYGMDLLNSFIEWVPTSKISSFLPGLIKLVFARLKKPTQKYKRLAVTFANNVVAVHGGEVLITAINSVGNEWSTPDLSSTFIQQVWKSNLNTLKEPLQIKLAQIAFTNLITKNINLQPTLWLGLLESTLSLFEGGLSNGSNAGGNGSDGEGEGEGEELDIMESSEKSFSTSFVRLVFATPLTKTNPILAQIQNPKQFFITSLASFLETIASSNAAFASQLNLSDAVKNHLAQYANEFSVRLRI